MAKTDYEQYADGLLLLEQAVSLEKAGDWPAHPVPAARLAEGMPFLMQVAYADAGALALAKTVADADDVLMQAAAASYLKQMYVRHAEDPYRVLGLNPWSGYQEAKERYRQLIRLFHPDRGIVSRAPGEPDYSANINSAFSAIGKASGEKEMDFRDPFEAAAGQKTAGDHEAGRFKMRFSAPKSLPMRWMGWFISTTGIYRMSQASVWVLIGLAGIAFIGAVYLGNRQTFSEEGNWLVADSNRTDVVRAIKAEEPTSADLAGSGAIAGVTDATVDNTDHDSSPQDGAEAAVIELNTEHTGVLPHQDAQLPSATNQSANEMAANSIMPAARASALPGSFQREQKSKAPAASRVIAAEVRQLPVPDLEMSNLDAAAGSETVRQIIAANQGLHEEDAGILAVSENLHRDLELTKYIQPKATSRSLPSADDLDRLVANFIGSYNEGDLAEFMNLMDDDLRTDEPGGKTALRQAYMQLFRESRIRELELSALSWQRDGDIMVGSTEYVSQLTSRRDGVTRTTRGHLRLEVSKQAAGPRISGFYQMADRSRR